MSTTENALTAHIQLLQSLDFPEKMKAVQQIKQELKHHHIQHCTIEIDEEK